MSTARRVWLYGLTAVGLVLLMAGVRTLLSSAFDLAARGGPQVRAGFIQGELSLGLALLIIGAPLWFLSWRVVQRNVAGKDAEVGSLLRKFYLNAVVLITALIALNSASDFLMWLIGGVSRFTFPSGVLAFLVVATITWVYHLRVSEREGHPSPGSRTLRRWYVYVLSGYGLVWLTSGLVMVVNAAALSLPLWGRTIVQPELWSPNLQRGIAWIVPGGLAWWYHWFRMSRSDAESTLRQVYLYLLATAGSAIAGLAALAYSIDRVLLWASGGATDGGSTYFEFLGWTIPLAIVSAAVWAYHQQVVREEAGAVQERRLSARRVHFYLMSFIGLGATVGGLNVLAVLLDLAINARSRDVVTTPGWWRDELSAGLALLIVAAPVWLYCWSRIIAIAEAGGIAEWRARSRRAYLYTVIFGAIAALAAALVNILYQLLNAALTGSASDILRNVRWSLQFLVVATPLLVYHWRINRQDQRRGAEAAALHKEVTVLANRQRAEFVSRLEQKLGFRVRVLWSLSTETEAPEPDLERVAIEILSAPGQKVMVLANGPAVQVLAYEEK